MAQNELTAKDRLVLGIGGTLFISFVVGFNIGNLLNDIGDLGSVGFKITLVSTVAVSAMLIWNMILIRRKLRQDGNEAAVAEEFRKSRRNLRWSLKRTFYNPNRSMPIMFFVFGMGMFIWQAGPVIEPFFHDTNHKIGASELQQLGFGVAGLCIAIYGYTKRWRF